MNEIVISVSTFLNYSSNNVFLNFEFSYENVEKSHSASFDAKKKSRHSSKSEPWEMYHTSQCLLFLINVSVIERIVVLLVDSRAHKMQ